MRQYEYAALIHPLEKIADRAGQAIMAIYGEMAVTTQQKADQSPVTNADLAAHHILVEGLRALWPDCPVVSDEDASSWGYRQSSGRFWLIDPLDGTREFLAKNGEFTVNIALMDQGRSVLGVVYAPAIERMYWGGAGLGAFCRKSSASWQPVCVSPKGQHCRVVASRNSMNAETLAFIKRLGQTTLVQAGSSLKFCCIAEGTAEIYPRLAPTCEWDTAAAQAVLEGAGGAVVDANEWQPLRYGKPETLNPFFVATCDMELIPHD